MKQWTIVIAVFVFLGAAVPASAQKIIGVEFKGTEGLEATALIQGLFKKTEPVSEESEATVGFYVYGLADRRWAQIHGGLSYNPTKWIGFTAGVGTEVDKNPWRTAASVWAAGHGNSAFVAFEYGGSGLWYRAHYLYAVHDRVEVGVFSRRFSPTGPFAQVKLAEWLSTFVVAGPNLETSKKTLVVGLDVAF